LAKGINASYQYVTSEVPALFIQAMIIRRSFLHKLGGFDEQTNSDDWALNIKIFQSLREPNEFAFEDIDVFLYRSHENQFHNSSIHMNELIQRVASNYFTSSQLAKFKLKYELITILREIVNFNLVGAATSFGRARNLVNELKMPVFGIFIEFLSVVYRSLILKKYLYFSLRKRVTFKN
jgi:hypothetical protein